MLGGLRGASSGDLPLVRQSWGNDCGPAALATVAAYHGCPFAHDDFADEVALDRGGTDLLTLSRVAERLGFRAQGIKASYDDIPNCRLPAIAHVRHRLGGGHFVVLYRWTPTHVLIGDPAAGLQTISRKAFCRRSTGYLLIIEPAPAPLGSATFH
jgi:ATP-binding cassette, subfamily B, bacterial HlyB/CyaB